jgi:hypothetical protein
MNRLLAACLAAASAGFFTFGLEDIVNETKEKTAELVNKATAHAQGEVKRRPTGPL